MGTSKHEPDLDDVKKREVLAILCMGCGRATAARYAGCSMYVIDKTAQNDPQFAEQLRHADVRAEVDYMRSIRKAANQQRYWRAAAWALKRKNPAEYAPRPASTMTCAQVEQLLQHVARLVVESLPASRQRKILLKRLHAIVRELLGPQAQKTATHAPQIPAEH